MPRVHMGLLLAAGLVNAMAPVMRAPSRAVPSSPDGVLRCTMAPAKSKLLLRIDRDTTLTYSLVAAPALSYSGVQPSAYDSLLAGPDTPMPAARVSLLQVDLATRAELRAHGVSDTLHVAYIRAAPYRADCRTIRYIDSVPWVVPGDTGFARATLAPREAWLNNIPVFVISAAWDYPFPRQSASLQWYAPTGRRASAREMYSFVTAVEAGNNESGLMSLYDSASRERALTWARTYPVAAETEPIRRTISQGVLVNDIQTVRNTPSRLRGTYRVTMTSGTTRVQWVFRTVTSAAYSWTEIDTARTTASIVANPHVSGTRLVGYAASSTDSLPLETPRGSAMRTIPLVWMSTTNRPSAAGDDTARTFHGELMFKRTAAPEAIWDALDPFVPAPSAIDSLAIARLAAMNNRRPRAEEQPRIPMTWTVDQNGVVRGTKIVAPGEQPLDVVVELISSVAYSSR